MQINYDTKELEIVKQCDRLWIVGIEELITDCPYPISEISFNISAYGTVALSPSTFTDVPLSKQGAVADILEYDSQLINSITLKFQVPGQVQSLNLNRVKNKPYDHLHLVFSQVETNPKLVIQLAARVNSIFRVLDLEPLCASDDEPLARMQLLREADVADLRGTYQELIRRLENDWQRLRDENRAEAKEAQAALQAEHEERAAKLQASIDAQQQQLDADRAALAAKIKEVDDRESKFARREIYKELRKKIGDRYQKFELTLGTRKLRRPINWAVVLVLVLFGTGFAAFITVPFLKDVKELVFWNINRVIFALLFGSTLIYYFRWHNSWFKRHADEEFRLKKFDLDMDRASWIVEMMIEWGIEKEVPMPESLLEHLTRGIFIDNNSDEAVQHPAEQIASLLFGASSKATIKTPTGSVELDRKGMQKLQSAGKGEQARGNGS